MTVYRHAPLTPTQNSTTAPATLWGTSTTASRECAASAPQPPTWWHKNQEHRQVAHVMVQHEREDQNFTTSAKRPATPSSTNDARYTKVPKQM